MAQVKWIKIVTDIFDDEKILFIEQLPEADSIIVIWFKLLTLAGKINNGGVLLFNDKLPYTDEMLSTIFRRPINTVRLALKTFEQFEMVEIINDTITIPNWSKHQTLEQLEERKEYMKNYMRKYRENQKQLASKECKVNSKVNSKSNSKANVNPLDIEEDIDIDIDNKDIYNIFFSTYNEQEIIVHQKLTVKMKQAIDRALKKDKQDDILTAIKRYGEAFRDKSYQFCKYKMTLDKFLTQGNGYYDWLDEGQKWINYSDFKKGGSNGLNQKNNGQGGNNQQHSGKYAEFDTSHLTAN